MKNNVLTIMKKECARLFGDRKLVFSGILLQGLLIYILYTLLGSWMGSLEVDDDYKYRISVVNMPESISYFITESGLPVTITDISESEIETVKKQISAKKADLLIEFPLGFDEVVGAYDISAGDAAPHVQIWADQSIMASMQADAKIKDLLRIFERSLVKKFDVNALLDENEYDLNTGSDFQAALMMSMIPMLLLMVIYQGCMAIAPESIAGEKERGTLGTLLATPARRSDMAFAKILSITIFGVLGAAVSFIGLMLSLPNMMMDSEHSSISSYSVIEYMLIFAVTVSTVLVFVSILSVMSAYSKSIKEANSYAAPFLFVSMAGGMSSMFTGGAISEFYYYFIPVFNSAQSLTGIFSSEISAINITVTALTNVVFALICTGVLAKMFSSEKIVFDK